jgi:hypothetical protein
MTYEEIEREYPDEWQRRKAELMKQLVDTWRKSTKIELLVPLEDSSEAPPATKGN